MIERSKQEDEMKRTKETDRFIAKTFTGKEYVIIQYQEYIDVSSHDDQNGKILSPIKRLVTENGLTVSAIHDKIFKISKTNEIVYKD